MDDTAFDFTGRRFVVTGASSGIGREIARELVRSGATVLGVARDGARLESARAEIAAGLSEVQESGGALVPPGKLCVAAADVCDAAALEEAVAAFVREHGRLRGAVHAAGITGATPLRLYDAALARAIMDTSFWGGVSMAQLCNKKKYSDDGCSTVLFSSIAAYIGEKSLFAYSAAKAAVQVAARSFSKELYVSRRRINTVSPGWVDTAMTRQEAEARTVSDYIARRSLLGVGSPRDVSGLVLFLLCDRSSWITGQDFVCDGGYAGGGVRIDE